MTDLRTLLRYAIKLRLRRGLRLGRRRVSAIGVVNVPCQRETALVLLPFLPDRRTLWTSRAALSGADALATLDEALGPRWNRLEKKDGTLYSVATTVYTAGVPQLFDVLFRLRTVTLDDYERLQGYRGEPVERVVRTTTVCFLTIKFSIVRTVLPI